MPGLILSPKNSRRCPQKITGKRDKPYTYRRRGGILISKTSKLPFTLDTTLIVRIKYGLSIKSKFVQNIVNSILNDSRTKL